MKEQWLNMWNSRFGKPDYAYGEAPNEYFKAQLSHLEVGSILLGAEGEGRNAVYAAQQGWKVSAFDISIEGKNKAMQLAAKHDVAIDYQVGYLPELSYEAEQFDAIALIYAHFPADIRSSYHKRLDKYLKTGGTIIFEAFGKNHLEYRQQNPKVGGPGSLPMLFSTDELKSDFKNYDIIELVETEVELQEGRFHNGKGSVTRFVGVKQ